MGSFENLIPDVIINTLSSRGSICMMCPLRVCVRLLYGSVMHACNGNKLQGHH